MDPDKNKFRKPGQDKWQTNRPQRQPGNRVSRKIRPRLKKRFRGSKRSMTSAVKGAQRSLKNFRQASILAVAVTGFFMLMFSPGEATSTQTDSASVIVPEQEIAVRTNDSLAEAPADTAVVSTEEATREALGALQNLWDGFFSNLPKMLIALGTLALAWVVVWLLRKLLRKILGRWNSSNAIISLAAIAVWLLAVGVALSVVAGDIRALVGSLGLIGLALSWSLQTPIESFTGWLLNSFQGYYRIGDRIRVGEVFGDVYRIDFLTTTVWEIGSPYQGGFVNAEQATGRMVTFPNNEILTGTVTNLTRDFPYVWDELIVSIANESNLKLAKEVLENTATNLLGNYMVKPARRYSILMKKANLPDDVAEKPQIFLSTADSWTNLTIRYLVGARERRKWKSELIFRISEELNKPEYRQKIIPVYPRQQVQFIDPEGIPVSVRGFGQAEV